MSFYCNQKNVRCWENGTDWPPDCEEVSGRGLSCCVKLLSFVCVLVTKLCLLIGICNRRMWLIDWFTDWSDSGLLSSPRYYFPSLSPCFHTFILLPLLNIPSSRLSSGSFYFLFAPLFYVLFYSLLNSPSCSVVFSSLFEGIKRYVSCLKLYCGGFV